MKAFEVKDFNGGMVDEVDDTQPRFARRHRNLLLDAAGKPYQRNGLMQWAPQIPTSERVSNVKIFRDMSHLNDSVWAAFAYSHHKLWVGQVIDEYSGVPSWAEVRSTTAASWPAPIPYATFADVSAKTKLQLVDQSIYGSIDDRIGGATNLHIPRRIWFDGGSSKWTHARVGAPPCPQNSVNFASAGGAGNNYVYWFVFVVPVTIGPTDFEFRGTPDGPHSLTNVGAPNANTVTISQLFGPSTSTDDAFWPVMRLEIYRTVNGGTVPKLVGSFSLNGNPVTAHTFLDTVADGALGQNLYTSDGTAPYDQAPACKLMHIVNQSVGYYGGFDGAGGIPGFMGAIQSSPGVAESAPSANLIATPDHLTGIENIDIYPIFFTRKTCWRVEGTIDAFGGGNVNLRPISERVGAIRQSCIAKTDQGLIFASDDGVYYTDGFSVKKLSDHLNKYYRSWFHSADEAGIDHAVAVYHPPTKRYFFNSYQADAPTYNTMPNTLHCGDMRHTTDEGGAAHSYHQGEQNQTTNGLSFLPTAVESFGDSVLVGDAQGYICAMKVEPTDAIGGDIVPADDSVDGSVVPVSWGGKTPIVWDFISAIFDFGNRITKKWATRFQITMKIRQRGVGKVYAQVNSINDGAFWSDSMVDAQPLKAIRDSVTSNKREWTVRRFFKKLHLRFLTKQIQIKKAYTILFSSNPNGVRIYTTVTVNAGTHAASLSAGSFPDVIGQDLFLALDGYVRAYKIATVAGGSLTVLDPGAHLVNGVYEWEIKGYDKDQSHGIESFLIGYQDLAPGTQPMFNPSTSGVNP